MDFYNPEDKTLHMINYDNALEANTYNDDQ